MEKRIPAVTHGAMTTGSGQHKDQLKLDLSVLFWKNYRAYL
jgi:hypothetical protein